jgi:hypothetical protein
VKPLVIQGMHGLGDCLHQRAVVKHYLELGRTVFLETSWPSVYHDYVETGQLRLVKRNVALRTQTKNAVREHDKFHTAVAPMNGEVIRVMYHGTEVMKTNSKTVLEAMCNVTGTPYESADFRLPVPDEWAEGVELPGYNGKPILLYRPLVARPEWKGSIRRNAHPPHYAHVMRFLRRHYFVISVADLEPGREWLVGPQLRADLKFHEGQLTFEQIAALTKAASLVVTSSGFAAILGPAVGTPTLSIIGGYEDGRAHDSGMRFAPYLAIEPEQPCRCWSSACAQPCTRKLNMSKASLAIQNFIWRVTSEQTGKPLDIFREFPLPELADLFDPEDTGQATPLATPFGRPAFATTLPTNHPHYLRQLQMMRAKEREAVLRRGGTA